MKMNSQEERAEQLQRLCGIDQYGRIVPAASSFRSGKQVGMFFWLWIGQPTATGIYDATKLLSQEDGMHTLFGSSSEESPDGQQHFWGEPVWGYYNSVDTWVMRRQLEMLSMAGIDFIVFDTTNAITYRAIYEKVMCTIVELQQEGWNPPKAAFYTHSHSLETLRTLYGELYAPGLFRDAWYCQDGKPMIVAYTNVADDMAEAASRSDTAYHTEPLSEDILDFFTFRKPQWPFDPVMDEGFPWIEWVYPQPMHNRMMSVSVATHPRCPFSFSLTHENWVNWGRGYDPLQGKNCADTVDTGGFFQFQWDHAVEADPDLIFVDGWNEWVAYKQMYDGEYMLCDTVNREYSRDIEPMNGGYEDAFYLQLIANVRRYKGIASDIPHTDDKEAVTYYNMRKGETARDCIGVCPDLLYYQAPPCNQIAAVRVSHDERDVSFFVFCSEPGKSEIRLLIGSGIPRPVGWEGYEFEVKFPTGGSGEAEIWQLKNNGSGDKIGTAVAYTDSEGIRAVISRELLNLTEVQSLYFKVADGVEHPRQILDYYRTGSVFPMGRLSYLCIF